MHLCRRSQSFLSKFIGLAVIAGAVALGAPAAGAQKAPQYLPTSEAGPHGSAPKMRVKLLTDHGDVREYAVVFGPGDEPFAGLTEFARKYHVQSGHFTAIGGFENAKLGWYDDARHMFRVIPITEQSEVVSLVGDIALYHGQPIVHMHCVVASSTGVTHGGHILDAHVFPTLEVFVTADPLPLYKAKQSETGLVLVDPSAKH